MTRLRRLRHGLLVIAGAPGVHIGRIPWLGFLPPHDGQRRRFCCRHSGFRESANSEDGISQCIVFSAKLRGAQHTIGFVELLQH
jgi:hypothetical protein